MTNAPAVINLKCKCGTALLSLHLFTYPPNAAELPLSNLSISMAFLTLQLLTNQRPGKWDITIKDRHLTL